MWKLNKKFNCKETGADGYILKPFDFKDFDIILKYLKTNTQNFEKTFSEETIRQQEKLEKWFKKLK